MTDTKLFSISTKGKIDVIDITSSVQKQINESNINSGIVNVFMSGSTGGITNVEYEPGLVEDIKDFFNRILPYGKDYKHHLRWGCDNGSSHLQSVLLPPSFTVPFNDKTLLLGTWQQIIFIDFDTRPRNREIICQIIGD